MTDTPTSRNPWQAWKRFWFSAADPTTLGFMRVMTGLLVLYVHLAYTFDLQAFFGRYAWYDLASVNRERTEFPTMLPPFNSYEDSFRAANVPEFPHRRKAVMDFIRALPTDASQRASGMRFLNRLQATNHTPTIQDCLRYCDRISIIPEVRKAQLDTLEDEKLRKAIDTTPDYLTGLPSAVKKDVRGEIETFQDVLPRDAIARQFVLAHLMEMEVGQRKLFLEFLRDLPDDPDERKKVIDYLEHWNNEARRAYSLGNPIFSIWFHIADPTEMYVAHAVILVIFLMFTLGIFTRVTSVLAWLAMVGYIHRSQQVLFGMDTMMNLLMIYLMVGNCGAAFSIDRLVNKYRAARASLGRTGTLDAATKAFLAKPTPSVSAGFALRLVQVHFCFIYLASGLSKLKGAAWWNTTAFWDTLINPEFTMVQFGWYEWALRAMVENRPVFALVCAGGVMFTFIMEIGLPFLIWTRLRPYVVIGALVLHFGIATGMGLVLFGLFMMCMLLAYLPAGPIREAFASNGPRRLLRFRPKDEKHIRAAAVAAALDTGNRLDLAEAKASESLALTQNGTTLPTTAALGAWRWLPGLAKLVRG